MNVLVVGGAGYVGGALTDALAQTEHDVRVYDALVFETEYLKPVEFVRGDIRDTAALRPHLDWADAVVWLAAVVADAACDIDPSRAIACNRDSVRWLAETFHGRIVFPSTCLVYALCDAELTETSPTDPQTLYMRTKLEAEHILDGHNALIFRLSTLFGVGDRFSRPRLDLVTNGMTASAVADGRITVFGGGQHRPFLHVRDAAQAMVSALSASATGVYNIAWNNRSILELAQTVVRHVPACALDIQEAEVAVTGDYRVSAEKVKRDLGFVAARTIDEGIIEMRDLIAAGRLLDIHAPRYNNAAFLAAQTSRLEPSSPQQHPV